MKLTLLDQELWKAVAVTLDVACDGCRGTTQLVQEAGGF
jgi:hypothetical protein